MKTQQEFKHLYQLYLTNQCTAQELEAFFALLRNHGNDEEITALLADTWDETQTVPDTGLTPQFLPLYTEKIEPKVVPTKKLIPYRLIAIAASILIVFASLVFFKNNLSNLIDPVQQQAMLTHGERKQLQLDDGTKVWLSPNSKLSYPDKFTSKQRLVSLDGEAFFEVAHDAAHPFIIKTGKVSTTVLGTSFNINAYQQKHTINVTLVSGKVAVALNTKNVTMLPNQQIIVDKTTAQLTKIDFPGAASFLHKRLGLYEYQGTALKEVIKDLETQYGIQIQLDSELVESNFYGNLNMNDPISQTLNKLGTVMEIKWKRNGGQYVIIK
ncbi:FecR family protein [Pedobacter sp. Hv1]|uniref:FecR family protein n=1 Tax=Pedobacter sp. Hv1 TaxID=1740090 RepID=UPI0006D8D54F|nr:FecR family protein [Pedobacter sp. Hv1]KQC00645.1 hypothetical protein AQF98_08150 [Pedobacter sp. Hv1]